MQRNVKKFRNAMNKKDKINLWTKNKRWCNQGFVIDCTRLSVWETRKKSEARFEMTANKKWTTRCRTIEANEPNDGAALSAPPLDLLDTVFKVSCGRMRNRKSKKKTGSANEFAMFLKKQKSSKTKNQESENMEKQQI